MQEELIYKVKRFVEVTIVILFIFLNLDVIRLGVSPDSIVSLGFPFRHPEVILALDRAPIASRLTIILIFLVIIDSAITYLLTKSRGD